MLPFRRAFAGLRLRGAVLLPPATLLPLPATAQSIDLLNSWQPGHLHAEDPRLSGPASQRVWHWRIAETAFDARLLSLHAQISE